VGTAKDAIAFAERHGDRPVPIELRAVGDGKRALPGMRTTLGPLVDHAAIRQAYDELVPRLGRFQGHIIAADSAADGTDIAITGRSDEALGKCLTVRSAVHCVQRMVPVDASGAAALARNAPNERVRHVLEDTLLRVSAFFEDSGIESFDLDPVRLHEHGCTVLDATLRSRASLHRKARLQREAHDHAPRGLQLSGRQ
jgi:hypothetical protein